MPWWVLADICAVLEIGNPSDAAQRLDDDEKHTLTNVEGIAGRQVQEINLINESGLWSLVLTSRKPEARVFKKWLTSLAGSFVDSAPFRVGPRGCLGSPLRPTYRPPL